MTLDSQIESILFWKGEPTSIKKLGQILDKSEDEIRVGISELADKLRGRGLELIQKDDAIMLGAQRAMGPVIEKLIKEDLSKDLGKAGLETLSIILYRGPVTRRDIDYIRGVNSQFILRNLLVRGLVDKNQSSSDQRAYIYTPTFQLLSYLGAGSADDLPEYLDVRKELEMEINNQSE